MNIAEIMVNQVASCKTNSSLNDVALAMWNKDCGCIPVVNTEDQPVGMVTDRDIAMGAALKHKALWEIQADEIIADKPVYSCQESDDVNSALKTMEKNQVRRLPVTDENGKLTGIVSMGDIVARLGTGKDSISFKVTERMMKAVSGHHGPLPIAV